MEQEMSLNICCYIFSLVGFFRVMSGLVHKQGLVRLRGNVKWLHIFCWDYGWLADTFLYHLVYYQQHATVHLPRLFPCF